MSHIPNSAMPHARPAVDQPEDFDEGEEGRGSIFSWLGDKARDNPRTTLGAGAAMLAGAIAALTLPLLSSPKRTSTGKRKSAGSSSARKAATPETGKTRNTAQPTGRAKAPASGADGTRARTTKAKTEARGANQAKARATTGQRGKKADGAGTASTRRRVGTAGAGRRSKAPAASSVASDAPTTPSPS